MPNQPKARVAHTLSEALRNPPYIYSSMESTHIDQQPGLTEDQLERQLRNEHDEPTEGNDGTHRPPFEGCLWATRSHSPLSRGLLWAMTVASVHGIISKHPSRLFLPTPLGWFLLLFGATFLAPVFTSEFFGHACGEIASEENIF